MKKPLVSLCIILFFVGFVLAVRIVRGPVPALQLEPAKIRGNANAKVSLILFSDFQCPYCKKIEPVLNDLLKAYPNDLKIVFKHFPLKMHEHAEALAEASECAADQGKFWEFHDHVFEHIDQTFDGQNIGPFINQIAAEEKINLSKFKTCVESGEKNQAVRANQEEGQQALISGTPTLLLNGLRILPSYQFSDLKKEIEKSLNEKRAI